MKTGKLFVLYGFLLWILVIGCNQVQQREKEDLPPVTYKMTTPMPEGIGIPDKVTSRLGTLDFRDGFPDDATVEKLYDNLDFQRAVQAYLLGMPAVNMNGLRRGITAIGPANITIPTFETLMDSKTLWLTANCNTPYTSMWIDLRNGPLVLEVPPGVLGMINDFWGRYVVDVGMIGPDRGEGGKYLVLPPGYDGAVPEGYIVTKATTFECLYGYRQFKIVGDLKETIENMKKHSRVYPLSMADNPPANTYVNVSGTEVCTVAPSDFKFWEYLNEVVQGEPKESFDRVSLGYFASIGIEKGKPFAPDARMKKILTEAALVGDATARAITYRMRQKENYAYENSSWRYLFLGGYKFETTPGILNLDGSVFFYFSIMGVSPAEEIEIVGKGSQYIWTATDANGKPFDGANTYQLHLPPGIPVRDFWSLILYDVQTRSFLQTDQQFPMISSQDKELILNADGSVDAYFGPEAPAGKEHNWIQTIPGKGWFIYLRLYGPEKSWFDKSWRPGEIEIVQPISH